MAAKIVKWHHTVHGKYGHFSAILHYIGKYYFLQISCWQRCILYRIRTGDTKFRLCSSGTKSRFYTGGAKFRLCTSGTKSRFYTGGANLDFTPVAPT